VWRFEAKQVNLVSVERLGNGNTLLVDDRAARIFEVTPAGQVAWSIEKPEYRDQAMRRARRTPAGTTVVAVQKAGLLLEYDPQGREVRRWELSQRMPAFALPQADGGLLLGLAGPGEVRRVDAAGRVRASFAGAGSPARMAWTSGFAPVPGGGLIVSDYMGSRIVEFDAKGTVVHRLEKLPWSVTSISLFPD
jgi:hypothetical protein